MMLYYRAYICNNTNNEIIELNNNEIKKAISNEYVDFYKIAA